MRTTKELAHTTNPERVSAFGKIRRMAIRVTARALWQLVGYEIDGEVEAPRAEAFTGIGIAARPPRSSKPEAIVVNVGDAKVPVIIAVRDEATRAAVAGGLVEDETAIFNSAALVYVKANGTIEARTKNGTAVALATKADLDALRSALTSAVVSLGAGGVASVVTAADALTAPDPWPKGTKKLKGE